MTYNKEYYLKNRQRILQKYHERKRREQEQNSSVDKKPTIYIERKTVIVRFDWTVTKVTKKTV